jgi:hypothetical protein
MRMEPESEMPLKQRLEFLKMTHSDLKELMNELTTTKEPTRAESIVLQVIEENGMYDGESGLKRSLLTKNTAPLQRKSWKIS